MDKNQQLAQNILKEVGGIENVSYATHCMTRLRLSLKDESLADDEKVKAIKGVLGVAKSGGQYQVIVGQNVPKVYAVVNEMGGFSAGSAPEEGPKEKLTLKAIGTNIMNYLSGSMTQLISPMIAVAMFRTLMVVLGPDMLGMITAESDTYILLDFIYDAFFYFLPIFLGYAAARKLNVSPLMGMLMGALLVVPDFAALVGQRESLMIYGLFPAPVASYGQTVLPVLLAVWLMSYPEKFFKKIIPDTLSTIFVPTLTLGVMVPLLFCICAPVGGYIGQLLSSGLIVFGEYGGFLAVAVVAALWEFLVMSGMHSVMLMFAITTLMENGSDSFIMVAGGIATWAAFGMALGAFLKQKNKEDKAESLGYFVSGILGGVTEPVLFGVGFRYKKPFIALLIGGFIGGLYAGLMHVAVYVMGSTNFLALLGFVAGGSSNMIHGCIASIGAMLITAAATYLIGGFQTEDHAETEESPELEPVLEI